MHFPSYQDIFWCIFLQVVQNPKDLNTMYKIPFYPVGVFHALYNVKLRDKHENVLTDMCWNDAFIILGLEDQDVGS